MTTEPAIRFAVTCPKCRQEVLTSVPIGVAAAALISGRAIRLYAICHDVYWDAHYSEIEQIRESMAAPRASEAIDEADALTLLADGKKTPVCQG
jgi:hypothetical protein